MTPKELLDAIKKLKPNEKKELKNALQIKDTDDSERFEKETDEQFAKRLKLQAEELEILRAQSFALGEVNTATQQGFELRRKIIKAIQEMDDAMQRNASLQQELEDALLAGNKEEEERIRKQIKINELKKEELQLMKDKKKALDEELEDREEMSEKEEDHFKYMKGEFTDIAVHLGLNSRAFNSMFGKFKRFQEMRAKYPDLAKQAIQDTFSFTKIFGSLVFKIGEAFLKFSTAVDQASAAFAAQTGAGRAFTQEITNVGSQFRNLGINAEEAGKAAGVLFDNFTGFMRTNQAGQEDLMQTVAALERIGVDGATSARSLNLLTKNFGMSIKSATKLTKQLSIMGTELGISSKKMVEGFEAASKTLAVYGKESVKVFADIAAQAKAASVETSALLGIAEQFDTFSGAADVAGKLNAILGSQLSTTELLTMKENERIEAIIKTMQVYGGTFSALDKFTQKSLAAAVGISDLSEAQRIFGMSLSDYRRGLQQDQSQEEFNKRLKDAMSIMKKMEQLGKQFAIAFAPAVEFLASFLQKILDFNQETGGGFLKIVGVIAGLTLFGKALGFLLPFMPTFGAGAAAAAGGLSGLGAAAGANAMNFVKGGGALVAFAVGVGALFGAFSLLSGLGVTMDGPSILGLMAGFAGGLIAIGTAIAAIGAVMKTGYGAAILGAGLNAVVLGLAAIGGTISAIIMTINEEKLKALGQIFSGLGDMSINFKVGAFKEAGALLTSLKGIDASIKPVLGDLALIASGQTTQSLTTSATNYDFSQFTAKLENVFKPQVIVNLDGEQISSKLQQKQDKNFMKK